MTMTMFVILVTICCAISGLLTEGIKVWCKNAEEPYSANLIALIDAIIVGCGGGVTAYILLGIAFTTPNILCLVLMSGAVWLGSMVGYDKVIQLITQITGGGNKE